MRIADLQHLDDDALGEVLAASFDSLPTPDPARLAAVRDRLPHPERERRANRWAQIILLGILTGSGLAAAWWGFEQLFKVDDSAPASQPTENKHAAPIPRQASPQKQPNQQDQVKQGDDRRSPIIYQQEKY